MTPSRLSALATVDREGPLRMGELAALEGVAASTMTRIVDSLVDDGLLARLADARDRRLAVVQVSEAGSRLLRGARSQVDHYLAEGLSGFDPAQLELLANGISFGMFASPNMASVMNSVPARHRGAASGTLATFQNAGFPLSIGLFFSLMVVGLQASVPHAMLGGLTAHGVPPRTAAALSGLPPLGYLFAAFLGDNPLGTLLGPRVLAALPPGQAALLTGRSFFPS